MFKVKYGESSNIQEMNFEDKDRANEFFWSICREIDSNNLLWSVALWEEDWLIASYKAKNWR